MGTQSAKDEEEVGSPGVVAKGGVSGGKDHAASRLWASRVSDAGEQKQGAQEMLGILVPQGLCSPAIHILLCLTLQGTLGGRLQHPVGSRRKCRRPGTSSQTHSGTLAGGVGWYCLHESYR